MNAIVAIKRVGDLNLIAILAILVGMISFTYAAGEYDRNVYIGIEQIQITNVYCPVMPDMQTNPEIFTEYKGKRVYFCCNNCKAAFGKDPEKYIDWLPQFGGTLARTDFGYEHGTELVRLTKTVGIIILSLFVLTAAGLLFRKKVPNLPFKWHKCFSIIALVSLYIQF